MNLTGETMSKAKKKMLLFLTDAKCSEKTPIMATLAWLAKRKGIIFDSYISSGIIRAFGLDIDGFFFGDMHAEQFYYICNVYDVQYCVYGKPRRFLEDLKVFNKECVASAQRDLPEFYSSVFNWYDVEIPKEAIMVRTEAINLEGPNGKKWQIFIDSYCYPDIYYQEALGIGSNITDRELKKLKEMGVEVISTLYCEDSSIEKLKNLDFKVRSIDSLREGDSYGSITSRIADRWLNKAKGVATGDPNLVTFWLPFFCRNDLICLYDSDWKNLASVLSSYADKKDQTVIWGLQPSDNFITELSKFNKVMQIITYERPLFVIQLNNECVNNCSKSPTYWDTEFSDEELLEKAENGQIACCLLVFSENLCHSLVIPRMFELVKTTGIKIGIGTKVSWYEYASRWMKDILVPLDSGGCFPLIEPLLSSAGLGAATEAKGYISAETLLACLKKAQKRIAQLWGERFVPIGYYPWQDANPYYRPDSAEPQFDVIEKAGFKYSITCKNMNEPPRIIYQNDDFIVINQQNSMLDLLTYTEMLIGRKLDKETTASIDPTVKVPWSYTPLRDLKRWEKRLVNEDRPGWVIISIDSPFWGWSPFYFDRIGALKSAMNYIRSKGETGKLFSATPHETARYAKILESNGLL